MTITQAMVLAAGLGTRLRPITDTMPKPLVPVCGKAMIDYGLDALAEAGVTTCVVNVHHFPEQMEAHLRDYPRMEIIISDERAQLMNSGGGLAQGLKQLPPGATLVLNADLFWVGETPGEKTNLQRLADGFDPARMDMVLLCVPLERTTGHNGKKDFSLGPDGRLVRYTEGGDNPVVYAGALVLDSGLLDDAPAEAFNLNLYFDRAIAAWRLFGLMMDGEWITVGTPEALPAAEMVIRRYAGKP